MHFDVQPTHANLHFIGWRNEIDKCVAPSFSTTTPNRCTVATSESWSMGSYRSRGQNLSLSAQGSLTGLLQYGFIGYLGKSLIRTKCEIGDLHGICCMSQNARIWRNYTDLPYCISSGGDCKRQAVSPVHQLPHHQISSRN